MQDGRTPRPVLGWVAGTLIVGVLLSGLAAWRQARINDERGQQAFAALAERVAGRLSDRMQLYEAAVRGARGAVVVAGEHGISRQLFRRYSETRDIATEFPGARGFGFIRKVARNQEQQFLLDARRDGSPDFAIKQFSPHDGERYVVQYIEPAAPNSPGIGLDIGSEPERRLAAQTAMLTGKATLTGPIDLLQANGDRQRSALLLLPVYRHAMTAAAAEQAASAAIGWTFAPLDLKSVVASLALSSGDFQLVLWDVTKSDAPQLLFASTPAGATGPAALTRRIDRTVFGRHWQLQLEASPLFVQRLNATAPLSVLLLGLLCTGLLAWLVGALALGRLRERHNMLQKAQLAAIVENSADAIVGEDFDGRIITWNHAAQQLFGFEARRVLGQPLSTLLLPPDRQHEDTDLRAGIASGESLHAFETTRLHRDGSLLDVAITASAIRAGDGRLIGVAKLVRDNRSRKAADRQMQEFNHTLEREVGRRTAELDIARRDLQTVLDAMPSMIGYWDKDLRNRVANRAYTTWFGLTAGEMSGMHMRDLLGDALFASNKPHVDAVLQGQAQQFERAIPRIDGQAMRHVLAHYLPDMLDGEVRGFYVIVHDVTELTEGRLALTKERERLSNFIQGTNVGTWEWNVQTGETRYNERWAAMLGYRLSELEPTTGQTWLDLSHPDDLGPSRKALNRHFSGETAFCSVESRLRHKAGRWVWVLSSGRVFSRTSDGKPEWMYGTLQDITATKEAEAELARVAHLLGSVLRAATEIAVIATDAQGLITIFNSGAQLMLGYRADELVGVSSPAPLHLPEEAMARAAELSEEYGKPVEGFQVFVHKAALEGAETREWTYVRKDGSRLRVSLVVTAIRADDGSIVGFLGMAQDVTERHRAELALRQAKAAAEAANEAKSMFLANMSHEIRTPMNAVIGVAHLLASTPLDGDQRQLLAKLQIAGRSLLGIINNVLDLAKIEAGELSTDAVVFSPVRMLQELEQLFMAQADRQQIALLTHGLRTLPAYVLGDELRLRQILTNLISNAIKFTERGHVAVHVSAEAHGPGRALWLRWSVQDTGPGISTEMQARLFDPFTQADVSTTRRFGGTGLGLSIVHRLVHLMGGDIGVDSTPGLGSEFWVRLPFMPVDEPQPRLDGARAAGLQLVVVSDDAGERRALVRLCRALGWQATELSSGLELQAHVDAAMAGEAPWPDALLVDWQMPGQDGLQALKALAGRVPDKSLPAALIINPHERAAVEDLDHAGLVEQVLHKPVGASELFNAVNAIVARHSGGVDRLTRSTGPASTVTQWLQGLQILLVDDSDINLEVARRLLEREGARVHCCLNGREALVQLRLSPQRFDAVLMDVQMPEMDGYEATRRLRSELGLAKLPVLALTAGALGEERRKAEEAGMDDFLTKPLDPVVLVSTVRRAVERARGGPLPGHGGSAGGALPADWPAIEGIDNGDAAHRLRNDASLFLGMIGRLLREFDDHPIGTLEADDADRDQLIARVHKLRGSSGMLGAKEVHRLASESENALRAGQTAAQVGPGLIALEQALSRLGQAAAPVLAQQRAAIGLAQAETTEAMPLNAGEMTGLLRLLQGNDLAAAEQFSRLAPALRAAWGAERVEQLRQAIDGLDFQAGLKMLAPEH